MNKINQNEILEFVINNAKGEVWVNKQLEPGQEKREVWVKINYPATGKKYQRNFTHSADPTREKLLLENCIKSIAQEIITDLTRPPTEEETGWVFESTIYQVCPSMICGTNPCSCGEAKGDIMF